MIEHKPNPKDKYMFDQLRRIEQDSDARLQAARKAQDALRRFDGTDIERARPELEEAAAELHRRGQMYEDAMRMLEDLDESWHDRKGRPEDES